MSAARAPDATLEDIGEASEAALLRGIAAGAAPEPAPEADDFGKHEASVEHLAEISRNSRATLISMLLAVAYCYLTIGATTDAALLSNLSRFDLPIIQTSVPVILFYYVAPLLLFLLFVYFHMYLAQFWRVVALLPKTHPDGRTLDDYIYPWIISNTLLRAERLGPTARRDVVLTLERWVCVFLAWGLVPTTLILFWGRYLPRHDWVGTGLHTGLVALSVGAAVGFYRAARAHIAAEGRRARPLIPLAPAVRGGLWGAVAAASLAYLAYGALEGSPRERCLGWGDPGCDIAFAGMAALQSVGHNPFANLEEQSLSDRPPAWDPDASPVQLAGVVRADLRGHDLRHADARRAFLAGADFREADLRWGRFEAAQLHGADLRGADLTDAGFEEAMLAETDLRDAVAVGAVFHKASLRDARLAGADFAGAVMDEAKLVGALGAEANFTRARLTYADLSGAYLTAARFPDVQLQNAVASEATFDGSDFRRAWLIGAELDGAKLESAVFDAARLDRVDLSRADLPDASFVGAHAPDARMEHAYAEGADFSEADMRGARARAGRFRNAVLAKASLVDADLSEADLRRVDFREADLERADLTDADLSGADLSTARNLTPEQLAGPCGDAQTKLPDGLTVEDCRARLKARSAAR